MFLKIFGSVFSHMRKIYFLRLFRYKILEFDIVEEDISE